MKFPPAIKAALDLWMDCVARTLIMGIERFAAPRVLRFIEQDDDTFRVESDAEPPATLLHITDGRVTEPLPPDLAALIKGKRAELVLQPRRFLFRPLELPRRAGEFLDGIVRAQIDRLTPWNVQSAVFGCTQPVDIANDRIALMVAATARTLVAPYLQALAELGVQSVFISTPFTAPDASAASIRIVEQTTRGAGVSTRLPRTLLAALLLAVALTALTVGATSLIAGQLQEQHDEIARRISEQGAALRAGREAPSGAAGAQRRLALRKRETPSTVIVIEALSHTLPNDTYLTELRIAGRKLQIVGVTANAPALIPLIERSPHFNGATFFAPTTQASNELRERFHIETSIKPDFTPST